MQRFRVHQAFILGVLLAGMMIGLANKPDAWYAALDKPFFNPPNIIFGPVWSVMYFLIALAGAQTFIADRNSRAMNLWYVQLILNFLWTPVFFRLHSPLVALVIIVALLAAILAFIRDRWSADRMSALFFVAYAAWVAFATLLNLAIVILN